MEKLIENELRVIEDHGFERIACTIALISVEPDHLKSYLKDLVFDSRGNRSGFPDPVLTSLMKIYNMIPDEPGDPWEVHYLK